MGCWRDPDQPLPLLVTGVEPALGVSGNRYPRPEFIAGNDEESLDLVARQHVERLVVSVGLITWRDRRHQFPWLLPLLGLVCLCDRQLGSHKHRQRQSKTSTN